MFNFRSNLLEIRNQFYFQNENIELNDINHDNNCNVRISNEPENNQNKNLNNNSLIKINIKDFNGNVHQKDITFNKFIKKNITKYISNNTLIITINNQNKKITKEIDLSDFKVVNEFDNNLEKNKSI